MAACTTASARAASCGAAAADVWRRSRAWRTRAEVGGPGSRIQRVCRGSFSPEGKVTAVLMTVVDATLRPALARGAGIPPSPRLLYSPLRMDSPALALALFLLPQGLSSPSGAAPQGTDPVR